LMESDQTGIAIFDDMVLALMSFGEQPCHISTWDISLVLWYALDLIRNHA
jgi:hypothetical protein